MKVREKNHIFKLLKNVSQKLRVLHLCLSKDAVFFSFFIHTHEKRSFSLGKSLGFVKYFAQIT